MNWMVQSQASTNSIHGLVKVLKYFYPQICRMISFCLKWSLDLLDIPSLECLTVGNQATTWLKPNLGTFILFKFFKDSIL